MRSTHLVVLVGIGLLTATGTAVAADNTAPLPDAGVDQTVPVDSTVYLDASGSTDPDGEIVDVAWTVETPADETLSPDCVQCRRTEFDADTLGRYTVTLTVTDDDEATRSDTLYVTVTNESGPDVSLSGPSVTTPNTGVTFTATVQKDTADLQTLTWIVNDSVVGRETLSGSSADVSHVHSFDTTGDVPVRAVVYDTLGNRGSATGTVSVEQPTAPRRPNGTIPLRPNGTVPNETRPNGTIPNETTPPGTNGTVGGGSGSGSSCRWDDISGGPCRPAADYVVSDTDGRRVYEANGEPGLQLQGGNGIRDWGDVEDLSTVERGNNGVYLFDGRGSPQEQLSRYENTVEDPIANDITQNNLGSPESGDDGSILRNAGNWYSDAADDIGSSETVGGGNNNDDSDSYFDSATDGAADLVPNVDEDNVDDQSNANSDDTGSDSDSTGSAGVSIPGFDVSG